MVKTNGKFIVFITGPVVKYRLEIMNTVCPNAKDYLIFLTNKESYDLYEEFHNIFHFVILDDYTKDFPISLKYEIFPNYRTVDEFTKNIPNFYNRGNRTFFPYDAHRFILLYLLENDILNFAIIDSDFILSNDDKRLEGYFERITPGYCNCPWYPLETTESAGDMKRQMWNDIQPHFPLIKLNVPELRQADGFIRGYHCRNKEELQLLFDIWNKAIETLLTNDYYYNSIVGNNHFLYHFEWVTGHLQSIFKDQLGYTFVDSHQLLYMPNGTHAGKHCTRPEDTFYRMKNAWPEIGFDYSDLSSISAFIMRNKRQLGVYYGMHLPYYEITDTHVFTRIP